MGYLDKTGRLGIYKNRSVYAVDYKNFRKEHTMNSNDIFAVKKPGNKFLLLVFKGTLMGTMDDDGYIDTHTGYPGAMFKFYSPPQENYKEVEVVRENQDSLKVPAEPKDIIFSDYTKPVDEFFEGLHELWKEMEVQI